MKAKLDGIYSPDLPSGYSELPSEPDNCWVIINADIGLDDGSGAADCFTFYVTTPKYLSFSVSGASYRLGRGLIIIDAFDWFLVERIIEELCKNVNGGDWQQISTQLGLHGFYEFDY